MSFSTCVLEDVDSTSTKPRCPGYLQSLGNIAAFDTAELYGVAYTAVSGVLSGSPHHQYVGSMIMDLRQPQIFLARAIRAFGGPS